MTSTDSLSSDVLYDAALLFWRTVTNIFFREVRPRGAFHIPRTGPVIFVAAPHHNQASRLFLDPLLLTLEVHRETRRRAQFLIAAKSMKRKVIGFFATLMSSIPVARAADDAKPGTGRVFLSADDPCLVLGEDTVFTSEFAPKMQIMLSKTVGSAVAEVIEVISDTELRIKKRVRGRERQGHLAHPREAGRAQGERHDGAGLPAAALRRPAGDVPSCLSEAHRGRLYRHLSRRFVARAPLSHPRLALMRSTAALPGGSHDRTDLLPLKAGVAIMALGAMANDPDVKVQIVPVGLSYFHPHKFRSRAVVEFGSAMEVPAEYVDMFKQGGAQKREAVSKLLDMIYDGLKTVTIRAPDYDTLMLSQAARRLYSTPGQHLTLGQVVELNKRFLAAYDRFKDEPHVQELKTNVLKYNRLVHDLGLRDHQVPIAQKAGWKILGLFLYRLGLLAVWTILALPGFILNGPIFLTASIVSRKKAKEALAASVVKVAGRDVLATWKILISLGVAPLLYGFYAFLAAVVAIKANAPLKWRLWTPTLVIMALPFIGYAALKFGEAGMDVLKSLRPLVVALMPGQQRSLNRLKHMRLQLTNELAEVINEFGPKMYEDFDEFRLAPSASVPPSSGTPGIWRRKSSVGAVDAQGNLLVHPMFPSKTWLDERLFGWSRSAHRGTSAWAGGTRSHDISRVATPDTSDEEDIGDYDDVLGILSTDDGHLALPRHRSRSHQSSYADLQKLRMTASQTERNTVPFILSQTNSQASETEETTGRTHSAEISPGAAGSTADDDHVLHHREAHRDRKASLSDRVPVVRFRSLDPQENFKDCTDDINQEIEMERSMHAHTD
ncbi:hypothetical protein EVG20_g282 [Dentipellis fragilis]|uniref:Phospholipid/glycerol acyltransferase domain-containing protein n=1 Tax=Dentipellis fragilis TaxID=205917 RepID=A0A4Y9ZEX0_9AGAM|nr:hypothetical protein EVG20_g282 [Dentipellis fragilis]